MQGTPGIVISIAVGATVLAAIIGVFLVKCYLNWKRQHSKQKKQSGSVDGTIQQLVISSQPVDFVPLLIQDQLEEEEDEFENGNNLPLKGISAENLNQLRDATDSKSKGQKLPPPLKRLDTASSILDKSGRKLKKPMETGTRGESLYFDDGDTSESESSTPKKKISISGSPFPQRSSSMHGQTGKEKRTGMFGKRRSASSRSLSCESLTDEGPDHTPHMRSSVVSTVYTKAPRSKMSKPKKNSTSETPSSLEKPTRKKSRVPERRGIVAFKANYLREKHALEVHLINATGLPIKSRNFLNSFVRLSLKTPSKHVRRDSKVIKNSCNPIYDEKFLFDSVYMSDLQQGQLKFKVMHVNRVGVPRYEPISEAAVSLCDEDVMRGESVCRDLFERATKTQCAGELFVSICHQATSSRLKVAIMKLKDLPKSIKNPSVTVELTHKNEILQQLQVKTKRKTLTLEEEFSFEVATNTSCTLENFGVQFTVLHHDFIRGNEIVGQVRLAMDAPLQSEVKHWTAVVLSPHKPIAEWHKLHAPLQ